MASIWKHPASKYWRVNFTLPGGGRTNRSTRETDAKKAAKIADGYQAAARQRMTEGQIRRVMSDLYQRVSGAPLASATVRKYINGWLERRGVENGVSTVVTYTSAVTPFITFLGDRADAELMFVTAKDLTNFRNAQAERLSVASVNLGKGRSARRATGELSFHCLRHTATSLMKNAGISPAIVQDIIGHESSAVSAHYTHIEGEAKRAAIEAMPDVQQ